MDNSVSISCPKHNDILTSGLWNSFQTSHAVDYNFEWCGRLVRGHRVVLDLFISLDRLSHHSSYPQNLFEFTQNQSEAAVTRSDSLAGVTSSDDVESVMEFLYKGAVTVRRNRLVKILELARELNCKVLVEALESNCDVRKEIEEQRRSELMELKETTATSFQTHSAANNIRSTSQRRAISRVKSIARVTEKDRDTNSLHVKEEQESPESVLSELEASGADCYCDDAFHPESDLVRTNSNKQLISDRQCKRKRSSAETTDKLHHPISQVRESSNGSPIDGADPASPLPLPPLRRRRKATLQRCEECGYQSLHWTQFQLHRATHDRSIEVFRCKICSRRFLSDDLLTQHQLKHDPEAITTTAKLDRRAQWREKASLQKCEQCGYATMRRTQFKLHQATHDRSIEVFRCKTCSRRFLSADHLTQHNLKHSSDPVAKVVTTAVDRRALWREKATLKRCEHCNFKTLRKLQFELHAAKHDPSIQVFRCDKCVSTRFLSEAALAHHRLTHAGEPDIYECTQCDYKSPNSYWFKVHVAGHDPNTTLLKCDACYRRFTDPEKLQRHKESNHAGEPELHRCPHCKFSSRNKRCYQQHLIIIHQLNSKGETVPKRFKCEECDYSCVYRGELRYHVTTKHRTEKPFKCDLCPYASSRKGDIGQHVKAAHLNLKPHLCETCGQRCASQSSLEQHKRSHTGEKPFTCDFCSRAFSDRCSMKKHTRLHTSTERPYVCHVCGNSFNRRDNLKVHLRNVHKTQMDPDAFKKD